MKYDLSKITLLEFTDKLNKIYEYCDNDHCDVCKLNGCIRDMEMSEETIELVLDSYDILYPPKPSCYDIMSKIVPNFNTDNSCISIFGEKLRCGEFKNECELCWKNTEYPFDITQIKNTL